MLTGKYTTVIYVGRFQIIYRLIWYLRDSRVRELIERPWNDKLCYSRRNVIA